MNPINNFHRRALLAGWAGLFAVRAGTPAAVSLLATVRDAKGRMVSNLGRTDFSLLDEGRPQVIRSCAPAAGLPLTLGLVMDTSGERRRLISDECTAARRFLEQVLREDRDQGFLLHFEREVELLEELTASRQTLGRALTGLASAEDAPPLRRDSPESGRRRGRGVLAGTCLYNAIYLAADEVTRKQTGRKAVVVISSGIDTGSRLKPDDCIEAAQRADTAVFCILSPGSSDARKVLRKISGETGGACYEVSKKEPLDTVFDRIRETLASQYSLDFTPDRAAEGYHRIQLTANRKDLTVATRDGYYMQP